MQGSKNAGEQGGKVRIHLILEGNPSHGLQNLPSQLYIIVINFPPFSLFTEKTNPTRLSQTKKQSHCQHNLSYEKTQN